MPNTHLSSPRLIALTLATAGALAAQLVGLAPVSAANPDAAPRPGTLDPTFSKDGVTRVSFDRPTGAVPSGWAEAVVRDAHGRLILVGSVVQTDKHQWFALTRLTPSGSVDTTYGQGGRTMFDPTPDHDYPVRAAMAPGGKVVVLGIMYENARPRGYALARFTSNGRIDRSFGTDGVVTRSFGTWAQPESVVVQADGRILVEAGDGVHMGNHTATVMRYLADGRVDATFGTNGRIAITGVRSAALAQRSDGRLLVAWTTPERAPTQPKPSLRARQYTADGLPDSSFGVNGVARMQLSADVDAAAVAGVVVGANGRISMAGTVSRSSSWPDVLVAAFTAKGKPDIAFGGTGWRTIHVGPVNMVSSVVALSDGRIVVGGNFATDIMGVAAPDQGMIVLVLRPNGTRDPGFGTHGLATQPPGLGYVDASALLVTGNRLVVAGSGALVNGYRSFLAARYFLGAN